MNHEPLRYAHEAGHTDVCFSSDGSQFITCGADGDIRVWSTKEGEDPTHNCIGDWALSVRHKGDQLYVATGGNDVQILTFPEGERNGVLDRFVAPINQIAISRDSEHIALAGEGMEVKLIHLKPDNEKETHVFDGLAGPCLSVAVNSMFVASSCGDGKLRVWSAEDKRVLKEINCFPKTNSFANAESLCRVDFDPNGKFLAYPVKNGVVLLDTTNWDEFATLDCKDVTSDYSLVQFSPCGKYLVATTLKGDFVVYNCDAKKMIIKSQHPNSTPICGLMWNPTETGQIVYTDTEGQLGIVSNCTLINSGDNLDDVFTDNGVDFGDVQFEDDDDDDGENVISVAKLKKDVMGESESELNFDTRSSPSPRPHSPETQQQATFMPSSTPEHLNPRYMVWNEVGIIRSYGSRDDEDSGKSIEIEFHNATFHNSIMLQNYQDYHMGSLSKAAVAVANAKQLYVIPLNTSAKEWMLKLEGSPEEIVAIGTSDNLVCFGTSLYHVRVCSIFGTQRGVVSIPGPVVTMSCYQNSVLVAYHAGPVRHTDQCINIKLITFTGFTAECRDLGAPLGPEATLTWLGFTDKGTPAMMTSGGLFSLFPITSNIWVPFCDTIQQMKGPADNFFPTAVEESHQTLLGIRCRGAIYPSFTPKPTVCELNLVPPFVEPETDKSQLETSLFAWANLQVGNVDKKFTETGLRTFALACKNGFDQRALEFMELVAHPHLLNLSTKYAIKLNKKLLAEKLMELANKLAGDDVHDLQIPATDASTSLNGSTKKITLNSSIRRTPKPKQPVSPLVATPVSSQVSTQLSVSTPVSTCDDSVVPVEAGKNPFVKNAKGGDAANPLSLINKFAGVDYAKENKAEVAEKRKRPETESDKQREKQRKLDKFMFTKR